MWCGTAGCRDSDMGRNDKMKVLGITGGVGSGKSRVLKLLEEEHGAVVVQLDEVAKRLQRNGRPCFLRIVECFGKEVVGADGELDRAKLGALVFADGEKLRMLNAIVHPEVERWVEEDIAARREAETAGKRKLDGSTGRPAAVLDDGRREVSLYVIEAALLPGNGYGQICDEMWYIYAKESVRRERLASSRGYTRERIDQMMASQPDEAVFCQACRVVIDNGGTFGETRRQVAGALQEFLM